MSSKDFDQLKKSRSSYVGAVTRLRNRYIRITEENPSTFDLGAMAASLASHEKSATHCRKVQEDICDFEIASSDIHFSLEEELEVGDTFEESVEATSSLINRLMATRRAQRAPTTLKSDLEDLGELTRSNPSQDYSVSLAQLSSSFQLIRTTVDDSKIHDDHPIHREPAQFKSRIHALNSKEIEPTPLPLWPHRPNLDLSSCLNFTFPFSMGIS